MLLTFRWWRKCFFFYRLVLQKNDFKCKSCSPKKVNSSAKNGETVVISEAPLDIPYLKQQIKDIGYELVSYTSEPYEKKGFFHFGR